MPRIRLTWNNSTEQWRMSWAGAVNDGKFIQEFFDCPTFSRIFPGVSKVQPTVWKVKTELLYKEGDGG